MNPAPSASARSSRRALLLVLLAGGMWHAFAPCVAPASADALDDLRTAILPFRGIGYDDVHAYRVDLTLPEEEESAVPLVELWRAPAEYGLRASGKAAAAVVRSWAIFLEPLYVARASLLDGDLERGADRLRAVARIEPRDADGGGRVIRMELPAAPDTLLPELLRDVQSLEASLDARGRLFALRLDLRGGVGRRPETLGLLCRWEDAAAPQPSACTWTLPDGGTVRVVTTFRDEGGRRVPGMREVEFPSRYDPGESERIRIRYGPYALDPETDGFAGAGVFRFDENGLRSDRDAAGR